VGDSAWQLLTFGSIRPSMVSQVRHLCRPLHGLVNLSDLPWGLLAKPRCTPDFMLPPASQVKSLRLNLFGCGSAAL
jgi:hypothetical protein